MGAVHALETRMQAAVADTFAVSITRHLIQHTGNLGRQFIGAYLIRKLESLSPQLVLGKDGQCFAGFQRASVEGGNVVTLSDANHGEQSYQYEYCRSLHEGHPSDALYRRKAAVPKPSPMAMGAVRLEGFLGR